jgi:hypothetical protein
MLRQPNGSGHGLSEDAERARVLRSQPTLPDMLQRLSVLGGTSLAGAETVVAPKGVIGPFVMEREPRPKGIIDAFVKTCQRWQLSEQQQLILLGYGGNEFFGGQILRGLWFKTLQDVKDRTGYVLGISLGLGSIFNEVVEAELAWLNAPHKKLGGRTPMAVMLEGRMKDLMTVSALVADERAL